MRYTVYAPGVWHEDIRPSMENWGYDFVVHPTAEKNRADHPGMIEVLAQWEDLSRQERRGRGTRHRFDLTLDGVKALREEAFYRWEFHGGNGNPYMCEDPDPKCRAAALALLERCDEIIRKVSC